MALAYYHLAINFISTKILPSFKMSILYRDEKIWYNFNKISLKNILLLPSSRVKILERFPPLSNFNKISLKKKLYFQWNEYSI